MTIREYNQTVTAFSDNVYRFILKSLHDEEKAKDVVQDAFLKLWQKHEAVENEKAKSYLFTTAYRTMIDLIRRDKKQGEWSEKFENYSSQENSYSGLSEILNEALEKLPDLQRSAVMLRDYEGYNYEEIGEIMQLNLSQVKVYIFRARKKLKDYLVSIETVI